MSLTDQDLLKISELMDVKLKGLDGRFDRLETRMDRLENRMNGMENRMDSLENQNRGIKLMIENDLIPRVRHLEQCYTSAFDLFREKAQKIDAIEADVEILKKVVREHSEQLQKLTQ